MGGKGNCFIKQVHTSWLIASFSAGILLGIMFAPQILIDKQMSKPIIALSFGLFVLINFIARRYIVLIAILLGVIFGINWGNLTLNSLKLYQDYYNQEVEISGSVSTDPDKLNDKISLQLSDIEVIRGNKKCNNLGGKIWISVEQDNTIKRGDRIVVRGILKEGFGSFSGSMRSADLLKVNKRLGIDPMLDIRDNFSDHIKKVIKKPEVDLGMGILAGQKSNLDSNTKTSFMAASLTHILVASGYNLTILVRFSRRLFAKRSRLIALIFAASLVILFAMVTGISASMMRAGLVSLISLITWYYGRRTHPVVLILLVGGITALIEPASLWGDAGWYMSFLAFAGVIILAPLISDLFKIKPKTVLGSIKQILIETFSAQITTLPVIAFFMGSVATFGLLSNLLVLPILPLVMALTFLAGLAAYILPISLALLVAWPAQVLLSFIIAVAQYIANLPASTISWRPECWQLVLIYSVIIAVVLYLKLKTRHNFYSDNVIE